MTLLMSILGKAQLVLQMGSEDFRPEEAPVREVEGESAWTPDHDPATASDAQAATYTIKGGSFLCAPNFCMRYRPAARQPGDGATSTQHIGFRTVLKTPMSMGGAQP